MSYHLMLNFRQVTSPSNIFDVMNLVHDEQTKNLEGIIQYWWTDRPSFYKNENTQNWSQDWDIDQFELEKYLHTVYYYWPKLNLLAIAGNKHTLIKSIFDEFPCQIYFQNQSDNNYDTGIYSRIPIFKAIAESQIKAKYQVEQFHMIKDSDPELMYEIQTDIYETILKLLDLKNFIYNDYSPDIHVLNTSFMRTSKDYTNMQAAYSAVHYRYNQNRKETQNTHDMAESSEH